MKQNKTQPYPKGLRSESERDRTETAIAVSAVLVQVAGLGDEPRSQYAELCDMRACSRAAVSPHYKLEY